MAIDSFMAARFAKNAAAINGLLTDGCEVIADVVAGTDGPDSKAADAAAALQAMVATHGLEALLSTLALVADSTIEAHAHELGARKISQLRTFHDAIETALGCVS